MNQRFKLRFDQMRENNAEQDVSSQNDEQENKSNSQFRTLFLEWPEGSIVFYDYAHLISGEYHFSGDENVIKLNFSADKVTLYGYELKPLCMLVAHHEVELIKIIDKRYVQAYEHKDGLVTRVVIEPKDR